ncbi:hypothetical protein FQR65_LT01526 [Abscondita terminalis]|nr:hypothetical protein FQR65_LT01526 [Abscondita terminalis]
MAYILKLLFLCQLIVSKCNCEIKFEEENNKEFDECIQHVTETFFAEDDTLYVFSPVNETFVLPNNITNPRLLPSIDEKYNVPKSVHFKMGIVLHLSSVQDFHTYARRIFFNSPLFYPNVNPNIKWLVITSRQDFSRVFLQSWQAQIMHVAVLVYNSNQNHTSLRLYTANPQETINDCGKLVNMIREQNCKSKFEFPQALRKYTNCSFILVATNQVIHDRHVPYIKSQFFTDLIISRLNSSSTATDYDRKFFIDFKLIRMSENYESSSSIIYSGTAIWFVPKPRQMSTLKVITVIFQKILWICILFSFFVISLVWWIILKLKNKSVDSENRFTLIMLDMWGATLFGSVDKLPTLRSLRFLVISYIMYCIHIQALFTSKLLQSLTVPQYERAITSLEDVFHSNLQVFAKIDVCRCIEEYQCVAVLTGQEDYLNAAFFEVSNTFIDNTLTGNWYYAFHSQKWSYFTATLEKIMYIIFESGITNDFGQRSIIDDSKTVAESRQNGKLTNVTTTKKCVKFKFKHGPFNLNANGDGSNHVAPPNVA